MYKLFSAILFFILPGMLLIQPATLANAPGYGVLKIICRPVFNTQPLLLDGKRYVDAYGDSMVIDNFKVYIGNITFTDNNRAVVGEIGKYHLINARLPETGTFYIQNVREGNYYLLDFLVGVDSLANVSGAMGGDLDPSNGMYWAWNTGYIMAKLEGRSSVCKTLHQAFEFHIGGYIAPYAAQRNISLPTNNAIKIAENDTTVVTLAVNAAALLNGRYQVDLSKVNSIVTPGKEACLVADNFAAMFSIQQIINPK